MRLLHTGLNRQECGLTAKQNRKGGCGGIRTEEGRVRARKGKDFFLSSSYFFKIPAKENTQPVFVPK